MRPLPGLLILTAMSDPALSADGSPTGSGLTSVSLLHQVRAHDPDAWRRLVQLYSPQVFHWCRRAGLSSDDAADVLQNVFFAVATRVVDFRRDTPQDSFRGWLWGITRFKIADHFRALQGAPAAAGGSTALLNLNQVSDGVAPPDPEPSDSDDRTQLLHRALEMIRVDFAEHTWKAFWRCTLEGHPAGDVARDLNMTLDAVYQAKARVLRRVREEFAELLD
ncbi:MAG TPA: sigma-70 family RNA polymerase sigma factor [Gemmataceae bacterium]|nr:sigma-70 family RNA polymerase sigma factor [Gemmataceae bacterium]